MLTYTGIDTSIQEDEIFGDFELPDVTQYAAPKTPLARQADIKQIATCMLKAKFPVVFADYFGKDDKSVALLVQFSELLGIAVIDCGGRFNFPNTHDLSLVETDKNLLKDADFILGLDVQDLSGALTIKDEATGKFTSVRNKQAKVAHIRMDDYLQGSWASDYQELCELDIDILADSFEALSQLFEICKAGITDKIRSKAEARYNHIKTIHDKYRKQWKNEALKQIHTNKMNTALAVNGIWEAISREDFVVTYSGGLAIRACVKRLWTLNNVSSILGINSGGAGLGYGIGASIGAALHYKDTDKICIDLQSDGDFLYTPSALWTAAHYDIPLLIIIMNNKSYGIVTKISGTIARRRGRGKVNAHIAAALDNPAIDYPGLAKSFGIKTFGSVDDQNYLSDVLQSAVAYIKHNKKPVLIDINFSN